MTDDEKKAYEWAINQEYRSVAADYARKLAKYIKRKIVPLIAVADAAEKLRKKLWSQNIVDEELQNALANLENTNEQ